MLCGKEQSGRDKVWRRWYGKGYVWEGYDVKRSVKYMVYGFGRDIDMRDRMWRKDVVLELYVGVNGMRSRMWGRWGVVSIWCERIMYEV